MHAIVHPKGLRPVNEPLMFISAIVHGVATDKQGMYMSGKLGQGFQQQGLSLSGV